MSRPQWSQPRARPRRRGVGSVSCTLKNTLRIGADAMPQWARPLPCHVTTVQENHATDLCRRTHQPTWPL